MVQMMLKINGYYYSCFDVANLQDPSNVEPVLWVKIACATAMGLGTAIGGWKIIKTVGGNIMKIRPSMGGC